MKYPDVKILKALYAPLFLAVLVFGLSSETLAESACPKPRTTKDVLECVLKNSPASERARLVVEVSKANESAAGKFSNPTVSLQSGFLSQGNQGGSDHQVSLTQPIDLGGKRGSRVREAEASTGQRTAEQERALAELTIETLSKLNRLRQLNLEAKVLAETARTLEKLIALFKSRPTLTPEQETSLALFRTAESDMELKTLSLEEELKTVHQFFAIAAGFTPEDLKASLPEGPPVWESITPSAETRSPAKKRAEADLNLAIAELDSQKAISWPELAVGPYAQFQSDGTSRSSLFGVALTLELPVLSLNNAGRGAAHKAVFAAEKNKELLQKEEISEQARLLEIYTTSVNTLRKLPKIKDQEAQHNRLEKLFTRGVVPSSLVIESHRQLLEFLRSRHEREEKALEALWQLKALQGKISEADL